MAEPLDDLVTIAQIERRARALVDPAAYTWGEAGAGEEVTSARNRLALNRLALVRRVLRDVSEVDASSSIAGVGIDIPVFLAPVGALALYHPGDALAAAHAAADAGTTAFVSMLVGSSWEEVAATAPGRHFFQIYMLGDRAWVGDVLARVEAAGYGGICLTVDSPAIGRRDRSLERGFTWRPPDTGEQGLGRHGAEQAHRSRLTWEDLEWICGKTGLPVVVKGVMTGEDAAAAVESGVSGVYVSNHGGRVIDHEVSTIEVLAEVVEATGDVDVVVDGGFAHGPDVCKALALGAKAVGIGRLQCWGLAVGGREGLARVFEILVEEIEVTMMNLGCASLADIGPDRTRWSIPVPPQRRSGLR